MSERNRLSLRIVIGLAFCLFGLLLFAEALGLVDDDQFGGFWPLILVVLGVVLLTRARRGGPWFPGAVLVLVGAGLMAERMGLLEYGLDNLWPLIIILLGLAIMSRGLRSRGPEESSSDDARISKFVALCGIRPRVTSSAFVGGDVTAFMGSATLDLTQADLGEEPAVLDVLVLMGGIELLVPKSWTVDPQVTPFMGGVDDSTDAADNDPAKRLVINGFVMMGGVEIKN